MGFQVCLLDFLTRNNAQKVSKIFVLHSVEAQNLMFGTLWFSQDTKIIWYFIDPCRELFHTPSAKNLSLLWAPGLSSNTNYVEHYVTFQYCPLTPQYTCHNIYPLLFLIIKIHTAILK